MMMQHFIGAADAAAGGSRRQKMPQHSQQH